MGEKTFKFGAMADGPPREMAAFAYPNRWAIERTTGPERLVIAPAQDHVDLMLDLARELREPFGILYVLLLSRFDKASPGRYQSPTPCDRQAMGSFFQKFKAFFEGDGRHHVWVMSLPDHATLVYDQHNVIYAYGQLDRYKEVAARHGLSEGPVSFPVPHAHCYNAEFDKDEDRILKWWDWKQFPLQDGDDL
jgi:hypothetical protein